MAPIASEAPRLTGLGLCLAAPDPRHPHGEVLDRAIAAARAAERAGFQSLWVAEPSAHPPDVVAYEGFSLVSAVAVQTDAIHLGVVADGRQRRPPSILAKIVTAVDVISHGRAVLSLDGDRSDDAGVERLDEALAVARAVLEDEHPTVAGRIYSVVDAVNRPAPVQAGGVPVVVFLHGSGSGFATLSSCARSADAVVATGGAEAIGDVVSFLAQWSGERLAPRDRTTVFGQVGVDHARPVADGVAHVREAGADGCLVDVPWPWSTEVIEGLALTW